MADVFLSYSKADRDAAKHLADDLQASGYSVWDLDNLAVGESFMDAIQKQIDSAAAVVVLWSKAALQLDWIKHEARFAHTKNKIVPVRVGDFDLSDIPAAHRMYHVESIENLDNILGAIDLLIERKRSTTSPTEDTRRAQLTSPITLDRQGSLLDDDLGPLQPVSQLQTGSESVSRPQDKQGKGNRVFICYRREDSGYAAGFLNYILREKFPNLEIFMDVDNIEPGSDFREAIFEAVQSCDVILVFVGQNWANIADQEGKRRIEKVNDFVRLEIEAAFKRNVRVIPVLISNAQMPEEHELPEAISAFSYRSAVDLRHSNFIHDVALITGSLEKFFS